MKKIWTGCLMALCLSWSSSAVAEEELNISSDIGVYSQYLWRGEAQGAGQASIQGDTYLELNGIEVGAWFASLGDPANSSVEVDLSAVYSTSLADGMDVSLGYIWYTYSNRGIVPAAAANNATEVFGEISYGDYWSPSIAIYYDTTINNWWIDLGVTGELANDYVVDFNLSYQKIKLLANGKSGFKTFDITLSKALEINDIAFSPSFTAAIPMGTRKSVNNLKTEFVFGVNFSY